MPGPAPKKYVRRRNARPDWVQLPAEGRTGPTPKWPLKGRTPAGWVDLWRTPQAVMWEQQGNELLVARYLKLRNLIQNPDSLEDVNAASWGELRQLEDRLGLSPMAMKRLMWEVEETPASKGLAEVTSIDRFADL